MRVKVAKAENWNLNKRWILASATRLYSEPVKKFCYHSPSKTLYLGHGSQNHKEIVNVKAVGTLALAERLMVIHLTY